jgi:hypothetical protein
LYFNIISDVGNLSTEQLVAERNLARVVVKENPLAAAILEAHSATPLSPPKMAAYHTDEYALSAIKF